MKALVLGRRTREHADVVGILGDRCSEIEGCHDTSWGCTGLDDRCPLDHGAIDVAVAVADPSGGFDAQGIACVHRARIPIVAVGATPGDPVLGLAVEQVPFGGDLLAAVERAAVDVSGHVAAVEAALAPHVRQGEHVRVRVDRRRGSIAVRLIAELAADRVGPLADRARAAIREFDPRATVIDVAVGPDEPSDEPA